MAPNNALGNPTAAELRAKAEGERVSDADGFGAGALSPSQVVKAAALHAEGRWFEPSIGYQPRMF